MHTFYFSHPWYWCASKRGLQCTTIDKYNSFMISSIVAKTIAEIYHLIILICSFTYVNGDKSNPGSSCNGSESIILFPSSSILSCSFSFAMSLGRSNA